MTEAIFEQKLQQVAELFKRMRENSLTLSCEGSCLTAKMVSKILDIETGIVDQLIARLVTDGVIHSTHERIPEEFFYLLPQDKLELELSNKFSLLSTFFTENYPTKNHSVISVAPRFTMYKQLEIDMTTLYLILTDADLREQLIKLIDDTGLVTLARTATTMGYYV